MKNRLCAALSITALLAVGLTAHPAAALANGPASPPQAAGSGPERLLNPRTVTLLTGDTVEVGTDSNGRPAARVVQRSELTGTTSIWREGDQVYVVPDSATRAVAGGQVDLALFNVTRLVADGYDDASSDNIPLISTYPAGQAEAAAAPRDARLVRSLPSVSGQALQAPKSSAVSFWSGLTGVQPVQGDQPTPTRAVALAGGVAKLWLDDKVQASLDASVPSVGGPEAWSAGLDGKGTKVAVLDTGIDANHPDFAGRIVASQNFTTDPDTNDGLGHGTHVTSIAAGTGAASGGKYKGVAPAASLLVGKVLDNGGTGPWSGVIAGMEWAAAQGAKVANMSLGGLPDSGEGPISQAVNRLSADKGILFVIAAGNSGPFDRTVSQPGTADAALTVSATEKTTPQLASFSSRGPRFGDYAVKPEISSPGADIVAARAKGGKIGRPVGDNYAAMNGTSMATPHVAGAAAILSQRHPDWTGQQLKTALVNYAATDLSQPESYQGGGRLRVPEAVNATVTATPATVSLGYFPWPHDTDVNPQKTVTIHNDGDAAVSYDLTAVTTRTKDFNTGAGDKTPGLVTVSPAKITVPAHGTAAATVTADVRGSQTGFFSGYVTASVNGAAQFDVPVQYAKETEQYKIETTVTGRSGTPIPVNNGANLHLLNLDTGQLYWGFLQNGKPYWQSPNGGGYTFTFKPGRYAMYSAGLNDYKFDAAWKADSTTWTNDAFAEPNLVLDKDLKLDIDFRKALPVNRASPEERRTGQLDGSQTSMTMRATSAKELAEALIVGPVSRWPNYALPSTTSLPGSFAAKVEQVRQQAVIAMRTAGPDGRIVPLYSIDGGGMDSWQRQLPLVNVGAADPATIAGMDLRDKVALVANGGKNQWLDIDAALHKAGARAALYPVGSRPAGDLAAYLKVTTALVTAEEGARLAQETAAGQLDLDVTRQGYSPYVYQVSSSHPGGLPQSFPGDIQREDLVRLDVTLPVGFTGQVGQDAMVCRDILDQKTQPKVANLAPCTFMRYGGQRTEYVQPDHRSWVNVFARDTMSSWIVGFTPPLEAGERMTQALGAGPIVPSLVDDNLSGYAQRLGLTRDSASLSLATEAVLLGGRHYWGTSGTASPVTHLQLWRGQQLLAENTGGHRLRVDTSGLPPEELEYRARAELDLTPIGPLATTKTSNEWTFRSSAAKGGILALPCVWLEPNVGDQARERLVSFRAGVPGSVATTKLSSVTVETSYDDGANWQPAPVSREDGNQFSTRVDDSDAKFASLRINVVAADGSTVQQTVIRAFALQQQ